jgi:hypothetical protein
VTLVAFTIPDDPAALPGWLERRLVAPDFARFVAELAAAHPERGRARLPARQLLGDWYRKALSDGLAAVPTGVLQQLLRHPHCLLELQEAVLTEGGPYWDDVAERADELTPAVDRGRAALEAMFDATPPRANPERERRGGRTTTPLAEPANAAESRRPPRSYFTWAVVSSALAACLLVAVGYLTIGGDKPGGGTTEVAAVNWGWAKPGGIPNDAPKPAEYLDGLANTAQEWFNKRPEDAAGVAKRINEFRTGCSQLIFATHTPLDPKDRDWLVEKCRLWAKKLDDHLTALENGADPLKVRTDADNTIRNLQKALREKAAQLG